MVQHLFQCYLTLVNDSVIMFKISFIFHVELKAKCSTSACHCWGNTMANQNWNIFKPKFHNSFFLYDVCKIYRFSCCVMSSFPLFVVIKYRLLLSFNRNSNRLNGPSLIFERVLNTCLKSEYLITVRYLWFLPWKRIECFYQSYLR